MKGMIEMPRTSRQVSKTGIYHVVIRGCGRQVIFTDDSDRKKFLALIEEKIIAKGLDVLAWCLMDNHVHLVVEDPSGELSAAMHALNTAYARYFNVKTGHVGDVFQGRFHSDPIESEAYLLSAVRYVHNNPEVAGVMRADLYAWSSYRGYLTGHRLLKPDRVLAIIGGRRNFEAFSREANAFDAEARLIRGCSDGDTMEAARVALGGLSPMEVKGLPERERDEAVRRLGKIGFGPYRIERLTGIGRTLVKRILQSGTGSNCI